MTIKIEGIEYTLPVSTYEITLGQRIDFDNQYGKELKQKLKEIVDMQEGEAMYRDLAFTEYHCELAVKTVSFFGNIPLQTVEQTRIDDVLLVYHQCMKELSSEPEFDTDAPIHDHFMFQEELWVLQPPQLTHESKMTFGEFIDAKQWVKNLVEFSDDSWEALLMLCCIYFRKKGEKYTKELAVPNGERYSLLRGLPLEYAIHVGFFFLDSMNTYKRIYHSSPSQEVSPARS